MIGFFSSFQIEKKKGFNPFLCSVHLLHKLSVKPSCECEIVSLHNHIDLQSLPFWARRGKQLIWEVLSDMILNNGKFFQHPF